MKHTMAGHHYHRLGIMVLLHFIAMYILMYAMVHNIPSNVYNSLNQLYMAGLMTASMGAIELTLMGAMYPDRRLNKIILVASIVSLIVCWMFIRKQVAIGDEQFIRSMVPHHSGAILMCNQANIKDKELSELCRAIVASQQQEIEQMKAILKRLD